ncbi:hypothetical protein [Marinobacter pelagius]|uniref:Uncharacterized protein n=1 Tax=Marinobacter pelagius TaxID=379482 RepID=A0A1I4QN02_9GAMM|nr:hypothetical protein [Marinobacter pelagius]SFM41427.1 hypothetical protein SAMN04487961_0180 [Marinobacter pelagius]
MTDHTYTLKKISLDKLQESSVLRGKHFLEQFAALPFRMNALDELPEAAILDYLYRHPLVVQAQRKSEKRVYVVTGNLRSAALLSCLSPKTRIPVLVEAPAIPIDIFLTEVVERELLNLCLMAMHAGGHSKAVSALFSLMGKHGTASSLFPTKSRLAVISGVNRREI